MSAPSPVGRAPFSLADLRVPVRLFYGNEDEFTPPAWGRLLASMLPDATVETIENAGHSQIFERRVWETVIRSVL